MLKNQKFFIITINIILTLLMILGFLLLLNELEIYIKIIGVLCTLILSILNLLFFCLKKEKLAKTCFIFNIMLFIILGIFFILNITGIFNSLSDIEGIKKIIISSGGFGYVITFLIHLLQVVVLPAPSWIFILATTSIYGPLIGFIISTLGAIVGAYICFLIGRLGGKKAVSFCIGREDTEKYSELLNAKGKVPFVIMQLLPFFPDDIMCMIAGLSSMSLKFFSIVMIIVRPIVIGIICIFGSGGLIPFSGWGIPVWIILFVGIIVMCYYYFRNQDSVDKYLKKIFSRNN